MMNLSISGSNTELKSICRKNSESEVIIEKKEKSSSPMLVNDSYSIETLTPGLFKISRNTKSNTTKDRRKNLPV